MTNLQRLIEARKTISAAFEQKHGRRLTWRDGIQEVKRVLRGRYALRRCTHVGSRPRVDGPVLVVNEGTMRLGNRVRFRSTQTPVELATMPGGVLTIGDMTGINSGTSICAQKSVTIGSNCLIGNYCLIMDTDFHDVEDHSKMPEALPVRIEDKVWLAARVTVLKGVTIGEGAVVSAGSVVAVDVPAYTLVGGVPARVIRRLPRPEEQLAETPIAEEKPAESRNDVPVAAMS